LATPQSVSTTQNTPVTIRLAGSDSNRNATLTAQIVSAPSHGTLNNITQDTGDVTYTPNQDYTGDDSFTFKVNDGKVDSNNTAMVSIRVNGVSSTY
jgi:large repetitive protein